MEVYMAVKKSVLVTEWFVNTSTKKEQSQYCFWWGKGFALLEYVTVHWQRKLRSKMHITAIHIEIRLQKNIFVFIIGTRFAVHNYSQLKNSAMISMRSIKMAKNADTSGQLSSSNGFESFLSRVFVLSYMLSKNTGFNLTHVAPPRKVLAICISQIFVLAVRVSRST